MAIFTTRKTIDSGAKHIASISQAISQHFLEKGYDVNNDSLLSGGEEIHITKGGVFKELLGLRTSLNISLVPIGHNLDFNAGIGIFGQQFIPTVISMFFAWPVILTQTWGMVRQSYLDKEAYEVALEAALKAETLTCPQCSAHISLHAAFCPQCGSKL